MATTTLKDSVSVWLATPLLSANEPATKVAVYVPAPSWPVKP